jgi:hypothetical protein|tara:strand:+ start:148 stop:384 length:237 start_codon:yes stop_codon:yes gene_type:complete
MSGKKDGRSKLAARLDAAKLKYPALVAFAAVWLCAEEIGALSFPPFVRWPYRALTPPLPSTRRSRHCLRHGMASLADL